MQTQPCTVEQVIPVREKVPFEPYVKKGYTLDEVLDDACNALGVSKDKVLSKLRKQEVSSCRMIYCYVAKLKTNRSYKSIGELIGGRDHTTVIHSCNTINNHFDTGDQKFLSDWNRYLENSKLFNKYDF